MADLDRAYNTYKFSIEDTLNFEEFDPSRVQANGRLFFNQSSIPDYENPLPGSENAFIGYEIFIPTLLRNCMTLIWVRFVKNCSKWIFDVNEPPMTSMWSSMELSILYTNISKISSLLENVHVDNPESLSDVNESN